MRIRPLLVVLAASVLTLPLFADAPQIRLPRLPKNIPREIPRLDRLPTLDDLLNRQPLTSTLDDAVTEVPFLDRFTPAVSPLLELPFGFDDGVTLVPGAWEGMIQSYCLKAGTVGPTRGDGYLWAPLKGPKAEVIKAILNRSARFPDVPQQDVQVLLWAIIARTKVSTLNEGPRRAAEQLLDQAEISSIDGSALEILPDEWLRKITGPLDGAVRRALEAENRLREVFANPGAAAYEELERIAVLNGLPAGSDQGRELPSGRWSWHPDGFFIRFLPNSYTNMRLQIYSPERFTARYHADGGLAELRDVAGATLRLEPGAGAVRILFTPAGGAERLISSSGADGSDRVVRDTITAMERIVPAGRRGADVARDVAALSRLAAGIDDEDALRFVNRALASAAGDWARTPDAAAALEQARYQSASLGGLLARPMPAVLQRRGGGWGGGGGGAGGGGGGGGMGGGGRQRLGPSLRKYDGDNSLTRARKAVDVIGKGNNALGAATDPAGLLGMGIPDALFGAILDFNFDTWGQSIDSLAGDPPRDDFREFSKPELPELPRLETTGQLTAEQVERVHKVAAELLTANAYMKAAIVALDRHGGAVKNGDRVWATRQAHALTYLKREAGLHTLKVVEQLEALTKDASPSEARTAAISTMRDFGAHFASLPAIGAPW